MYGREVNKLNVLRKSTNNNQSIIWTKQGNQGNVWLNGLVDISSDMDSTIIFEGVVGLGYYVKNFIYKNSTLEFWPMG